jgi:membrane protein implicated in regulation of membrane protease activity
MAKGRIRSTMTSLVQNWTMTQKVYRLLPLEVVGFFLGAALLVGLPIWWFLNWPTALLMAIPAGLLAATFWFSRRAMRAAYKQIEGQPGAAAAVIQSMRGGTWAVTPAVAVNKSQDIITRVVGRPGVVLVSEGPSTRVVVMLANERKKTARWLPDVPIYEIQVGNDVDQVPLMKLQTRLTKLPRNLRGGEITDIRKRLDALGSAANAMPIPKGPMPTSSRQVRRSR